MTPASVRIALCGVLLSAGAAWAQSTGAEAEAGDISEIDKDALGPLRERVRPVSGHLFRKEGRFEFSPGVSVSIKDAFFTKYAFGASLTYHFVESFGLSLHGGYSLPVVSGAAQICTTQGATRGCRQPTPAELNQRAPGQISLVGGLDLQWAPIYGKVSLIAEKFVTFDMYAIAGGNAVQYVGPTGATMTFGGNIGLGMRFALNRWMALRTELRDYIYVEQFTAPASLLRNQLAVEFGLSFFFPTTFREG